MLLPNSSFSLEFIPGKNLIYILDHKNIIKLKAKFDGNNRIIDITIFNNLGVILKNYTQNNERMFFEILHVTDKEVVIKILNRYSKTEKVRFF